MLKKFEMNPIYMLRQYFSLRKNLYKTRKYLENLQRKKLIKLISIAYKETEYYRKIFDDLKFHPNDLLKDFKSFNSIPIMSKKELQTIDIKKIISNKHHNLNNLISYPTSGSTGTPYYIYKNKRDSAKNDLAHIRQYIYNNWGIFSKITSVVGNIEVRDPSIFQKLGILPINYVSIDQSISDIISELQKNKFDILKGYTDDLRLMAKYLIDNKINNIRPKIVSTGGSMVDSTTEKLIMKAFKVKPMDNYGAADCGQISWQCIKGNYHINIDMVYVEVIKNSKIDSNDNKGEIVITNLWNTAFPLIRFKLGDIISLKNGYCECGCEFPLMEIFDGKTMDFIIFPNGDVVPPHAPKQAMMDFTQIDMFKIIQETRSDVIVQVVPNKKYNNEIENLIIKKMTKVFHKKIQVSVKKVKKINRGLRKFSTIESKIGRDFLKEGLK